MKSFFITGAAGFIGSHVCEAIIKQFPKSKVFVLDKLTYAGNINFIKHLIDKKKIIFIKCDMINIKKYSRYLKNIDCAINIAAESHVDNSFSNSINFTKTNVLGTHTFIQGCINNNIKKIIHVSTDEVYGDKIKGKSKETDRLNPTNPYSASKAAAEMIINSYKFVHKKNIHSGSPAKHCDGFNDSLCRRDSVGLSCSNHDIHQSVGLHSMLFCNMRSRSSLSLCLSPSDRGVLLSLHHLQ